MSVFHSLCFVQLLLLELNQGTSTVLNISDYFHCWVLRHLPNAGRSEFQTGRSMFICLQKHFSRAASCGHTITQVVPAPMSHASKLKGPMKTDLQNHCFHNHFSINRGEKHADFWVYKTLFLPNQSTGFFFFLFFFFSDSVHYILTKPLQADSCTLGTIHIKYILSWDSCLYIGWNKVQEKSKYCPFSSGPAQTCDPGCGWAWLRGCYPEQASDCFFPSRTSPTQGVCAPSDGAAYFTRRQSPACFWPNEPVSNRQSCC